MSATRPDRRHRLDPARARDLAVLALGRAQARRDYVRDVVAALATQAQTPPAEMGLALELAMGVMRHRLTLARLLRALLTGSYEDLPPDVRHILLVGAYQIVWLESIPDYAAVSEAVSQARAAANLRMSKLVNAVLRNLQRHLVERTAWSEKLPTARAIRYDFEKAWLLDEDVFADREQDFVSYVSVAASVPTELVTRWIHAFGRDRAEAIGWASQWRPPVVLRPNRLKTDGRRLQAALAAEGIEARHDPASDSVFLESAAQVRHSQAFEQGLFQIQDVTAQQALLAANLEPGLTVLDLCSGAGTKATQAAERMANQGRVWAYDVAKARLEMLPANARRLGATIVEDVSGRDLDALVEEEAPDVILVDAPCSNTGVLARRPEARYRFSPRSLLSLQSQQIELLERATQLCGSGTRIVYSTCSIEPEENEEVVRLFGAANADWLVTDVHRYDPAYDGRLTSWRDGGYWAILEQAAHVG